MARLVGGAVLGGYLTAGPEPAGATVLIGRQDAAVPLVRRATGHRRPGNSRGTGWAAGKLDRFGAIRISQESISIDSSGPLRWSDILEVRTRTLRDALSDAAKEALINSSTGMLPVGRGLTRRVLSYVADTALGILSRAEQDGTTGSVIPRELVYRTRLRGRKVVTPGPVATAMLALPQVAASLLATAKQHGIQLSTPES